ncbi:MAG: DNA primase small subunit domain-containing protein [archaeon]
MTKEERIIELAGKYYKRKDVQKALVAFSAYREISPRYVESFGKRPDALEYDSDVAALAERGATSFHCSEELWHDPLQIKTEMSEEQFNNLRIGWDLLLDIDTKYIEYGKITAELIAEALKFHSITNFAIKFSGGSGFHIIVPWKAFPTEIGSLQTKNLFPSLPRQIVDYLHSIIKKRLAERIRDLSSELVGKRIYDDEAVKKLTPDLILVSPRHLFRMPYSLHERTGLASIVIKNDQIKNFQPGWAKPEIALPKSFLPQPDENEAKELVMQAIDAAKEIKKQEPKNEVRKEFRTEINIKDLSPSMYPPCVQKILQGTKQDGRKRALFILLNFFKSIQMDYDKIENAVNEWNKKNYKQLREGYVKSQMIWFKRQKPILPPNCDKPVYKDIAICEPDGLCRMIKNPLNYSVRKSRMQQRGKKKNGKPSA